MGKKSFTLVVISALSLVVFAGCGTEKENTSQSAESSVSTTVSESATSTSSTKASQSAENQVATTVSSSQNATQATSTTEASSNEMPYRVDLTEVTFPITFSLKGVNVPPSITLESNEAMTVSFPAQSGETDQYEVQVNNIPTKEIRVFSNEGNAIRTVKANTELVLVEGTGRHLNETMYLIVNQNGGYSLLTPNYAGNVSPDQTDVMLEAVAPR